MAALELDRDRIEKLLGRIADRLSGDWVLLGGALAAVWFRQERVTEDIDLVSIEDSQQRRFELMEFASSEGLPVEAVNSAADFFLRRIPGWERELEPFRQGSTARIFRPSPTLFLLLKCERMSEADLDDCLGLVQETRSAGLTIDTARVVARLSELDTVEDKKNARERRARLKRALTAPPT